MKEKPNVKWDEVVGLDDAKKALANRSYSRCNGRICFRSGGPEEC